jgi:hypothetical protein
MIQGGFKNGMDGKPGSYTFHQASQEHDLYQQFQMVPSCNFVCFKN